MLPALTFTRRRIPARQLIAAGSAVALVIAAMVTMLLASPSTTSDPASSSRPLTQRLAASTWALAVPTAWLAAPLPEVRVGDSVDLIAVRQGDRPLALPIAADLHIMATDERSVVFEVDEESATAIATARASGLLIVPLLRSAR
ncbi:MAG: hypothetical protein AUH33_04415 [Chloroflexi bacterium 13_1_40CM_68_21]|nr:MAG: hypothetical protein AUH33_04415 [Chloroflexi bacterium 13_1_40CM_68_21]